MDSDTFDAFVRRIHAESSRRGVVRIGMGVLAATTFGLVGLAHPDDATAGGKCKPTCGECETCKKGKCRKTKHGKKCKKGKCQTKANGTACTAGTCRGGICAPPCADGIRNGSESDVDCGGGCPRCANGQGCATRNDCASALCSSGGTCVECTQTPTNNCGVDVDGGCECVKPDLSSTRVCVKTVSMGPFPSCASCPPDTFCSGPSSGGNFFCNEFCGAA